MPDSKPPEHQHETRPAEASAPRTCEILGRVATAILKSETRNGGRPLRKTWRYSRIGTPLRSVCSAALALVVAGVNLVPSEARAGEPDCSKWHLLHIKPGDTWGAALAELKTPPKPEQDLVSAQTRMSNWDVPAIDDPAANLMLRGLREVGQPWKVADVSVTRKRVGQFGAVVRELAARWGKPWTCGKHVKRFDFEAQGCFWNDDACGVFAIATENVNLGEGYFQTSVSTYSLDKRLRELLKTESAQERGTRSAAGPPRPEGDVASGRAR